MNKYLICDRESPNHEWCPGHYFHDTLKEAQEFLQKFSRANSETQFTLFVCENIIDRCHDSDHVERPEVVKESTRKSAAGGEG